MPRANPSSSNGSLSRDPNQDRFCSVGVGDGENATAPAGRARRPPHYAHSGQYTGDPTVLDKDGARGTKTVSVQVAPGTICLRSTGMEMVLIHGGPHLAGHRPRRKRVEPSRERSRRHRDQTVHILQVNLSYTGTQRRSFDSGAASVKNASSTRNTRLRTTGRSTSTSTAYQARRAPTTTPLLGDLRAWERDFSTSRATTGPPRVHEDNHATITNAQPPDSSLRAPHRLPEPTQRLRPVAPRENLRGPGLFHGRTSPTGPCTKRATIDLDHAGTELVDGYLTVKINLTVPTGPVVTQFYIVLWSRSASPYRSRNCTTRGASRRKVVRDALHLHGKGFQPPAPRPSPRNRVSAYPTVDPGKLAALGSVPRPPPAGISTSRRRRLRRRCSDAGLLQASSAIPERLRRQRQLLPSKRRNPKWTLDFSQDKRASASTWKTSTRGKPTTKNSDGNVRPSARAQIGQVFR